MRRECLFLRGLAAGNDRGLDHFTLRLCRGDFVELLGTENSGKALLTDILAGRLPIRDGFVRMAGRQFGPGEFIGECGIQVVGEVPSLAGALSVAENIELLAKSRRARFLVHRREMISRASFLLAEFGLPIRADMRAEALTEGEKRAVELLRAVESEASLLIIGDIFDSMGQADLQMIEAVLRRMKERDFTILALGSAFPRFIELDDRLVILREGRHARTFYRENYDRETYVKWMLGTPSPALIRDESALRQTEAELFAQDGRTRASGGETEGKAGNMRLSIRGLEGGMLRGQSLDLAPGEIVGLYDRDNLANKQLLAFLSGAEKPRSGSVLLDGKPYGPKDTHEAVRAGVDLLPRTIVRDAVLPHMGYADNVLLGSMRRNSRLGIFVSAPIRRFVEGELGGELSGQVWEEEMPLLSTGDRMRIALQRILLHRPRLLLVEDLVSDMNPSLLRLMTDYFSRYTDAGCSILISSKNLTVLRRITERVLVLL